MKALHGGSIFLGSHNPGNVPSRVTSGGWDVFNGSEKSFIFIHEPFEGRGGIPLSS